MPTGNEYPPSNRVMLLLIGDSGTGKTGCMTSLVKAGYNLRILDFDCKLRPLLYRLTPKEREERIAFVPLVDKVRLMKGQEVPVGQPSAAMQVSNLLTNWQEGKIKLGPTAQWTDRDVIVLDSLTVHGESCLRLAMYFRGYQAPRRPHPSEYGLAQDMQAAILNQARGTLPCHFIVTSHIKLIGGDEDDKFDLRSDEEKAKAESSEDAREMLVPLKGYPSAIGRQLPMKVGRYFDYIIRTETKRVGKKVQRVLRSEPDGFLEVQQPIPGLQGEWPIETGLADFFGQVRNASGETK